MQRSWVLPLRRRANKRETKSIKRFLNRTVAPFIGFIWIYLTGLTLRVTVKGKEEAEFVHNNDVIIAIWHSRLFYIPYYFRWQKRWRVLVSPSDDGDILDGILKWFGFLTIRGSSFKSPVRALLILAKVLNKGTSAVDTSAAGASGVSASVAMVADGSRGPVNVAQIGSVALAKLTGKLVVPIAFGAERKKNLGSWDKTVLPMPFTRINMVFGKPISVDKKCGDEQLETARAELENELNRITELADRF